jgi:dTDP-4-amino-4,6-dideoxygalactose transaminase
MATLAIAGGPPALAAWPHPHADRARFTDEDQAAISAYLSEDNPNSYFGDGGVLHDYERELAAYFNRRYCLLTNSGTTALHSAFVAVGIEPGDEVIGPVYTFHAAVTPLFQIGAVPVLADVEPDTGNIDPQDVARKITDRTRAIVVTHQYGHPVDGPAIRAVADQHKLSLIEDVSLAVGSTLHGVRAGQFGDVACFSLGSTKLLSGGQGGALVMDDPSCCERANLLGHFGARCYETVQSPTYRQFAETGYGLNYRMHAVAAAVSRSRFHRIDALIESRRQRYEQLSELIASTGVLDPPITRPGATRGSWQGYCATYRADRTGVPIDLFVNALREEGLEVTARGYHQPLHHTRIFQTVHDGLRRRTGYAKNRRTYRTGDFPVVEAHVAGLVGFPLFLDEDPDLIAAYGAGCRKVAGALESLSAA